MRIRGFCWCLGCQGGGQRNVGTQKGGCDRPWFDVIWCCHVGFAGGAWCFGGDLNPVQVAKFTAAGGVSGTLADHVGALDVVAQMNAGSVVIGRATVAPDFAREMESRCAAVGGDL